MGRRCWAAPMTQVSMTCRAAIIISSLTRPFEWQVCCHQSQSSQLRQTRARTRVHGAVVEAVAARNRVVQHLGLLRSEGGRAEQEAQLLLMTQRDSWIPDPFRRVLHPHAPEHNHAHPPPSLPAPPRLTAPPSRCWPAPRPGRRRRASWQTRGRRCRWTSRGACCTSTCRPPGSCSPASQG